MKDTFSFKDHQIAIRVFDGVPYFCAADIGKMCGYTQSITTKKSDKPVMVGQYRYISLHMLANVLSRATAKRREKAIELLDAIQREFITAFPIQQAPIHAAPIESDYDRKIKANQLAMEIDGLLAEESDLQSQAHQMHKAIKSIRAKIFERERELAAIGQPVLRLIESRRVVHE